LWSAWSDCSKILIPYGDTEGRANLTEAIDNHGCEAIKIFAQQIGMPNTNLRRAKGNTRRFRSFLLISRLCRVILLSAMSYIVFARKYRPQTFDDIIGQSHITTTLKNAIKKDRVAHAYLFAGPRGVGKTTTARILAKALDCQKGPTIKPCNQCDVCKEITQGSSLDILEIDGASNRGIDEIRNLRDNVKFAPAKGRFRIYIIDEVHMLTTEAFNALLKTLEEPPSHVKFIFATTQAHKVPSTILSRCQRFDFKRLAASDIFKNLKGISDSEHLKVDAEALALIAKHSDGSMRDAQVVLDQIASFAQGGSMSVEDVAKVLGVVGDDILFGISGAISKRDSVAALNMVARLVDDGKDVFQVVLSLIEHFRNITIAKISRDLSNLMDYGPDKVKRYEEEAKGFSVEEILYVIYTLSNTIDFIRKSSLARIPFEAALVKLTQTASIMTMDEVMKRIEALEKGSAGVRPQEPMPVNREAPPALPPVAKPENNIVTRPAARTEDPKPAQGQGVPPPVDPAGTAQLDEVLSAWTSIINYIRNKKISIASYLQEGYPVGLESNTLSVGFPKEFQFHKEMLDTQDNRRLIEEAIRIVLNCDLRVRLLSVEPVNIPRRPSDATPEDKAAGDDATDKMPEEGLDPIIKSALNIFNGEIRKSRNGKEGQR